jgi:hypothetical protein
MTGKGTDLIHAYQKNEILLGIGRHSLLLYLELKVFLLKDKA